MKIVIVNRKNVIVIFFFFFKVRQGSRKCGSTGAALLGNGRPNTGNDANWEKEKKQEKKERKKANGK